jgi:hypothetical protein
MSERGSCRAARRSLVSLVRRQRGARWSYSMRGGGGFEGSRRARVIVGLTRWRTDSNGIEPRCLLFAEAYVIVMQPVWPVWGSSGRVWACLGLPGLLGLDVLAAARSWRCRQCSRHWTLGGGWGVKCPVPWPLSTWSKFQHLERQFRDCHLTVLGLAHFRSGS